MKVKDIKKIGRLYRRIIAAIFWGWRKLRLWRRGIRIKRNLKRQHKKYRAGKFQYRQYAVLWANTLNPGDDIQTLAAIHMLKKHGIHEWGYVERETLSLYDGPPVKLIMNGWFSLSWKVFLPPQNIKPIFISFHLSRWKGERIVAHYKNYFKEHEPIGCRDLSTVRTFHQYGIAAYFSGCLTGCFDEVGGGGGQKNDAVYLVPKILKTPTNYYNHVMQSKKVHLLGLQNAIPLSHELTEHQKNTMNRVEQRLEYAQKLLDKYQHARLVITERLHVALPCRAFNTDVIFHHKKYSSIPRFQGLMEYLNGYEGEEIRADLSYQKIDSSIRDKYKKMVEEKFSKAINA